MPELPEVEVLRRSLAPRLVGARIARVEVHDPRLRERVSARRLERAAAGRRIQSLERRAKYLLAHRERGSTLVLHLGMRGRLTVCRRASRGCSTSTSPSTLRAAAGCASSTRGGSASCWRSTPSGWRRTRSAMVRALDTEMALKGEGTDPQAALAVLIAEIATSLR